ncbi:MAG: SRPBCC family protein [bacterium]|nr:SRPBCC family protein [bacterium]
MALRASGSIVTSATPREVLELFLDLERYKQVDSKIIAVRAVDGPDQNGRGRVRLWSRLRWTPPAPDVQTFQLERWRRLTFRGAPRQPSRLVFRFTGTAECEPTSDGTLVTHAYELTFRGPFRILEPLHRRWLQRDLDDEMARLADLLNQ